MTLVPTENTPIKDFTEAHERVFFRIDGDLFEAAHSLPGKALQRFAERFAAIESAPVHQVVDLIGDALSGILLPESNALFQKRLDDPANPITAEMAARVAEYLIERYGLRPTEPSSPSATGPASPASGTSSTDAAPQTVSIPAAFQPTATST